MSRMLAETNALNGLEVAHFTIEFLIALFMFWLTGKTKKIDDLEQRVTKASDDKINLRFTAMEGVLANHVLQLTNAMDGLRDRLNDGDREFKDLGEDDQQLELKLKDQTSQLKDYFRDKLGEHEKHVNSKFESATREISGLKADVKGLAGEIKSLKGER